MKDVILIPTYCRPEYLQLCLEKLNDCDGVQDKQIWLLEDQHPGDQHTHKLELEWTWQVFGAWRGALDIHVVPSGIHITEGNSFNVLEGYKRAFVSGAERVYLVEDDVLVTPDFLTWHEKIQQKGDFFCSVANNCFWKNREKIKAVQDPAAFYTAKWYGSYGVCWRRDGLAAFLQFANPNYFNSPTGYLREQFPNSRLGNVFTEQDGLIERVLEASHKWAAFPYVSRALHMGFYGYHRDGNRPNGYLQAKIDGLRGMIADPATLNNKANNPYNDLEPLIDGADYSSWDEQLYWREEL
jgi:hypothetical protein